MEDILCVVIYAMDVPVTAITVVTIAAVTVAVVTAVTVTETVTAIVVAATTAMAVAVMAALAGPGHAAAVHPVLAAKRIIGCLLGGLLTNTYSLYLCRREKFPSCTLFYTIVSVIA